MNKKGMHTHFLKHYLCLQSTRSFARNPPSLGNKKREALKLLSGGWVLRDSNPRPSGCKPDALNQLS